jgi:hypothetical protein
VISVLLGSAILIQIKSPGTLPVAPFFFLLGLTFALTVVYSLTVRQAERHRWIVALQLAIDVLIVSAIVHMTGGVHSYFSSLYALPIIAASVVQSWRAGMMIGTLSSLLYAGVALAQSGSPGPAAAPGRAVHDRPEQFRVFCRRGADRVSRRRPAPRRCAAAAGLERAGRCPGVQPPRRRQPDERTGDDRHGGHGRDVQPRGRGHHGHPVGRPPSASRRPRSCSCRSRSTACSVRQNAGRSRRGWNMAKNAAELLGLSFRQFRYLLKKYNIQ